MLQRTASYRTTEAGLPDLLNWAVLYDDGIVLGKDDSLMAGYWYRGPDLASASAGEHEQIAEQVNRALTGLRGGWAVWVDMTRLDTIGYPSAHLMHFPDPVSAAIDDERRALFMQPGRHFESVHCIILTYTPPNRAKRWFADMMRSGADDGLASAESELRSFKAALSQFENTMGGAVALQRMADFEVDGRRRSALVNYLEYTVSGRSVSLNLPPPGNGLDCLIGNHEFEPGDNPLVGDQFVSVIRFTGWPAGSHPGLLAVLEMLPFPLRYSTRYIVLDQPEAESQLKAIERQWGQKVKSVVLEAVGIRTSHVNEDAADMAAQASGAVRRTSSSMVSTGYYTPAVVLMHPDLAEVRRQANEVCRAVGRVGVSATAETINAPEAFLGGLPGHTTPNVRRPPLHSDNLADLISLTAVWQGDDTHPSHYYPPNSPPHMLVDAEGATPFFFNTFVSDLGHTLVFGPPGAGKSTLLSTVAVQALRYAGMTIWAFEKGRSMMVTAKACGGHHYDFGVADAPKFCPLADIDSETDLLAAEEWVTACFLIQIGRKPDPDERRDINDALQLLAQAGSGRTITDFVRMAQRKTVRDAMRYYALDGTAGLTFDATADTVGDGGYLKCFEIEDLMARGEAILLPALLHMFHRFEKSLHGQPAMLVLDEAWIMFAHEYFSEKIREWLKVLRKANCFVVLATQSLSDAFRSGILDVLLEAAPTKIYGANPEAQTATGNQANPGPREYYEMLGLSSIEIARIASATPKREYYFTSPAGRRMINLALGPTALAFVGAGGRDDIKRVNQLEVMHGAGWPRAWLAEKGLSL